MNRFDERLFQPVKAYNEAYKEEFYKNAENLFDSLVKKSNVDIENNRKTVSKYKEFQSVIEELKKKKRRKKVLRVFFIILEISCLIFAAYSVYVSYNTGCFSTQNIFMSVIPGLTGLLLIVLFNKKLKQLIADIQNKINSNEADANNLLNEAQKQMFPLNSLFDSHMLNDLMEITVPMLNFDYLFTYERFQKLQQKYGFHSNYAENESSVGIVSGEINGNPFVILKKLIQSFEIQTYTGHLTIHWTTTEYDGKGNSYTVHHTDVLTAHVHKPKPVYSNGSILIYCNDAAPDLHFSRTYSHIEKLNEQELKKFIKKKERKINKKEKKALKGKGSFVGMANDDFDAMFGALDRDNEVQFRLMYTPLAQNNTIQLLRDSENFGDDFVFLKKGPINIISSEHLQKLNLSADRKRFWSFDYDECRQRFLDISCNYFKSIFFEFAPLLCIPLYQQIKSSDYIYKSDKSRNYTDYETEYLANKMGDSAFKPREADTPSILKTSFGTKTGGTDIVSVNAHSFTAVDRVSYIPTYGGDGEIHNVPVNWTEYVPVTKKTDFAIKDMKYSDKLFSEQLSVPSLKRIVESSCSKYTYGHGMLGLIPSGNIQTFDRQIHEYLNTNKNSNLNNNNDVFLKGMKKEKGDI